MRRLIYGVLGVALLAGAAHANEKQTKGLPPLIDRSLFFGNPEIAGAQLSPDGQYIAFLKPWKDTRNIWVKKRGRTLHAARLLTTETIAQSRAILWSRDSKMHSVREGPRRR